MKISSLTHTVVLSLVAIATAYAGDVPSFTVKYGDLDLSRTEGAASLYRRINEAARTVCTPLDFGQTSAPIGMDSAYKHCISQAVSGAVSKIHNPQFASYAANKTGTPTALKLASR